MTDVRFRCARCGRDLRLIVHKIDDETGQRFCLRCAVIRGDAEGKGGGSTT